MPPGKTTLATAVSLLLVLTLASPGIALLLPAQLQSSLASPIGPNTTTETGAVARTIGSTLVHGIRGFDAPNGHRITPQAGIRDRSIVTLNDGGGTAPTSPGTAAAAPSAIANFQGLHTTVDCTTPPDSDGAVGPTYYVAFVNNYNNCATQTPAGNVGFYCKTASGGLCASQGTLAAAFYYPKLFSTLTTNCNDPTQHTDPQVVYDNARDHYLFTTITVASPFQICIASTLSNDPIGGSYCIASYPSLGSSIPDYEKAGIWLDGLYVTYNPSGDSHTAVINKDDLEACAPTIRTQDFDMGSDTSESDNQCGRPQQNHIFRPVPATYNILTGIPVAGEPEFLIATYCLTSHVYVFTLHVDWANPPNSILSRALIPVLSDSFAPGTVSSPGNPVDTLRLHLMTPAPYFKDSNGNEYLWTTKTVRGSSTSVSAVAWYQLKVVNNAPASTTVKNQNIWNPDSTSRLQAAAAFDRLGDVLVDYTQVSSSADPAIAYAGRLANDTANTLGQSEVILFRGPSMGSGACSTLNPCTRWGDYSSNFIDPDGCTFWFTHEYYPGTDVWQWSTRIGATKYPGCTPLNYSRTIGPSSLSFTSKVNVTSAGQNVTVTNTGTGPLVIQKPVINGTSASNFAVSFENCSTVMAGISPTKSCTVQITCTPSTAGTKTAALNIETNTAAADKTSISLTCATSSALTSPTIAASLITVDIGQSSTLTTTASFNGGTSPYTCQWLQKPPAATNYGTLSGTFSCNVGDKPTLSTGTLSTAGSWSFELQTADSIPTTVISNPVNVTANLALTVNTPFASPSIVISTQSSTLSAEWSGGTSPYTCQWLQQAPGASGFSNLGGSASCTSPASTSTGTLTTVGTWSFELQVKDSSGSPVSVISSAVSVTVNPPPPLVITFTTSPSVSVAMFKTNFTATVTGGTGGYSYSWAFGDGANGTGLHASHIYSLNGTYTVTLTVTDSLGTHAQVSSQLRVDLDPDFDRDGVVDIVDAAHVAAVYGSTSGDGIYDSRYDINWDGKITIIDAAIVAFYFGRTVGS